MPRHRLALTAALSIVLIGSFVPLVGPNLIAGTPQPQPVDSDVLLVGVDQVTSPRLIPESKVQPSYPADMLAARIEGSVMLQAIIDESGYVTDLELLRASPDDYPSMVESAMEAVRQWRYEPAEQHGEPVRVYFTVVIQFRLHSDSDGKDGDEESI